MANEKRLIDANALVDALIRLTFSGWGKDVPYLNQWWHMAVKIKDNFIKAINNAPTVDAVPAEQFNTLKSLVNGEWVDCKLVQEALGIDFATGLKLFDFSRTAEWNPAPLNGQKITTRFRLKNTVDAVEVVRCRDCVSFEEKYHTVGKETGKEYWGGYCYHWDYEQGMSPNQVDGNDFCSYGERRTDEAL